MADSPRPDRATSEANQALRKRVVWVVLAAIVLLFIAQFVALAAGYPEFSYILLGLLIVGWFALRSFQKRHPI
jgi:hypothetical protein